MLIYKYIYLNQNNFLRDLYTSYFSVQNCTIPKTKCTVVDSFTSVMMKYIVN